MTLTAERASWASLTDAQLAAAFESGEIGLDALEAECARRDKAEQAKAKRRASARERNAEWETAAYANYLAADARCRGFLLSEAGKATGRDPWPMLWQRGRETADKLASDDLITFWDYESPRPPSAREYAAAKRQAAAEQAARSMPGQAAPAPKPPAPAVRPVSAPRQARPAGSIAHYITALGALERQANRTARAMARVGR